MICFTETAWEQYQYWISQDSKTLKKINQLLKDCQRNPTEGIGQPEPLKGELSGYWSRRIDKTNRLVYHFDEQNIYIIQCKFHY